MYGWTLFAMFPCLLLYYGFNLNALRMLKNILTVIQSYMVKSVNMVESHIHYLNGHANRRFWLDDNIKVFYIISASKLNSYIIVPPNIL